MVQSETNLDGGRILENPGKEGVNDNHPRIDSNVKIYVMLSHNFRLGHIS